MTVRNIEFSESISIAEKLRQRTKETDSARNNILDCFVEGANSDPACDYFVAEKTAGDTTLYGLMSIKGPPTIQGNEKHQSTQDKIDKSVWVDLLVTDEKSGLATPLLQQAGQFAKEQAIPYVSLAAYEFYAAGGQPYSVAGYYSAKHGYEYTGEAYVEIDDGETNIYPIYSKKVSQ